MPLYSVVALEKFLVETTYEVEADSEREAILMIKAGEVAYDDKEIQEGDEEYIETISIEEIYANHTRPR
jgi:hypothetical protein